MRRWLLLAFLTLAFLIPWIGVKADKTVTLDALEVYLRPEYDQPSVLVTYKISINPDVSLPVTLNLHIPTSVGDLDYVTTMEMDGTSVETPYERVVQGDWSLVTITAIGLDIEIEYHDPNLTMEEAARSYTFDLLGDYSVTTFSVQVLQPIGATDMQMTPSLGNGIPNNNGTVTYKSDLGAIATGSEFSLSLAYNKSTDALTSSVMRVQPVDPLSLTTKGRAPSLNKVIIWILSGLGALLLVGGGVWFWQTGRGESLESSPKKSLFQHHKFSKHRKIATQTGPVEGNYCPQCGNRTQEGDLFCRMCGTKLSQEDP